MMIDERIDNGIEIAMISVDLQLPRNTRIITAVSAAAITASRITPCTAARTKMLWSDSGVIFSCGGTVLATRGNIPRMPLTTSSVDALPFFKIEISTPRRPSWRTMFVCTWKPSLTLATSRR